MAEPALRLSSRGSPLALEQARRVARRIEELGRAVELVVVETAADRRLDVTIGELAGRGAFVAEVELALLRGEADVAVHSAKDLPATNPAGEGLVLAAVPERGDPRDALVGGRLHDLAPGAVVATGSVRRRAQLAWARPDLSFRELRGNIARRLDKRPVGGAVVVAAAALDRLGLAGAADERLPVSVMLPQVGQGAIALRCRSDDLATRELLSAIDDAGAHRCVRAERAFLARLGGGCDSPVGAFATIAAGGLGIELEGLMASTDGHVVLRLKSAGEDAEQLGTSLAESLLEDSGGRFLLAA